MAYRFSFDEPLAAGMRRVAGEQLEDAVHQLETAFADEPVTAVHEARKDLKKTRALLRLVPGKAAKRERATLGEAGRALSGARDADVLRVTVDKLAERYTGQLPAPAFATVRDAIAVQSGEAAAPPAGEVAHTLHGAAEHVAAWPVDALAWSAVCDAAVKTYARGRTAFAALDPEPDPEQLHEWRKRVKELWYHQRLLEAAWPGVVGAQADAADALAEALGDHHDLAVLAVRLRSAADALGATTASGDVAALAERRQAELEAEARGLGVRLYAESPKAFRRRLGAWLRAARAEAQPPAAPVP